MALGQMITVQSLSVEPLLTAEDVAERLKVSKDWVWDHSSRRLPYLPVIRMSDGALRYRASQIEEFVMERERVSRHSQKKQIKWRSPACSPHRTEEPMGKSHQAGWVSLRGKHVVRLFPAVGS
jgi:predicted DNA-binding transcriptional regulator AlpA